MLKRFVFTNRRDSKSLLSQLWQFQLDNSNTVDVEVESNSTFDKLNSEEITNKQASSVEIGTFYENLCVQTLRNPKYGFQFERCGGKGDCGIDLTGSWVSPSASGEDPASVVCSRVVAQCKHSEKTVSSPKRLSVRIVREFEGVMTRQYNNTSSIINDRSEHIQLDGDIAVGMLISSTGFSKAALECIATSRYPLFACWLQPITSTDSLFKQHACVKLFQANPSLLSLFPRLRIVTEYRRLGDQVESTEVLRMI